MEIPKCDPAKASENTANAIIKEIAKRLKYCHEVRITAKQMKPTNVDGFEINSKTAFDDRVFEIVASKFSKKGYYCYEETKKNYAQSLFSKRLESEEKTLIVNQFEL